MAKWIRASVGMYSGRQCYNFADDQQVVQELLNRIPIAQGGAQGGLNDPIRPGIVSPTLHAAIRTFQQAYATLIADGHVDPGERTIVLLNQLAATAPPQPPVPPPQPPPPPPVLSTQFISKEKRVVDVFENPEDFFLLVVNVQSGERAVYWFGQAGGAQNLAVPQNLHDFQGRGGSFKTHAPTAITGLEGDGVLATFAHNGERNSLLGVRLPSGTIGIPIHIHLFQKPQGDGDISTGRPGRLQFLRQI